MDIQLRSGVYSGGDFCGAKGRWRFKFRAKEVVIRWLEVLVFGI